MGGGRRGRCRSRVANHAPGGGLPFLAAGSAGVGGARWGACPAGRRLTLPFRNLLGRLAFFSPAYLAFSFISCPHPPNPLPGGKGENQGYFMQGAPPLASPRLSRRRHGLSLRCRCPLGGLPGRAPADVAVPESVGVACLFSRPPTLPLVLFLAPIPPTPFPAGRGRSKVYFAGGFAPGTPALDRSRHLQTFPNRSPAQRGVRGLPPEWQEMLSFGQCRQPRRGGDRGRWNYPSQATAAFEMVLSPGAGRTSAAGGLPFFSPAYLAFSFISCPPSPKGKDRPPTPFPSGEGGDF